MPTRSNPLGVAEVEFDAKGTIRRRRSRPISVSARVWRKYLEFQTAFPTETPCNAVRRGDTANLLAKMLFERWPPRHQLKPQPVVDHREAPRGERHALAVDAGDRLTLHRRLVASPCFPASLAAVSSSSRRRSVARRSLANSTRCPCRRANP